MVFCNQSWGAEGLHRDVGHNPYFNRWFSAIDNDYILECNLKGHNPYFNRWFSAIPVHVKLSDLNLKSSQSLF